MSCNQDDSPREKTAASSSTDCGLSPDSTVLFLSEIRQYEDLLVPIKLSPGITVSQQPVTISRLCGVCRIRV